MRLLRAVGLILPVKQPLEIPFFQTLTEGAKPAAHPSMLDVAHQRILERGLGDASICREQSALGRTSKRQKYHTSRVREMT